MNLSSVRLYIISDRRICGEEKTLEALEAALSAVPRGTVAFQLREKDMEGRELFALAQKAGEICSRYKAPFFVNERLDIAILLRAGVHLTASSFGLKEARSVYPNGSVAISTHSIEEVRAAEKEGARFATLGPIFPTPSKAEYGEPLGLTVLAEACKAVSMPIIAVGGINAENISEVFSAGAQGAAMIREFWKSKEPTKTIQNLLRLAK